MAGASEVWASSTVKDLTAGSGLTFEDAGEHALMDVREIVFDVVMDAAAAEAGLGDAQGTPADSAAGG